MPPERREVSKGRFEVEIDMKLAMKSIVAAAAFLAVGVASAATQTVAVGGSVNGFTLVGGTGALTFDRSLVTAINTGAIQLSAVNPATATLVKTSTGKYSNVEGSRPVFNAPITVVRQAHGTTATFSGVWMADRYSTGRLDTELLWTEPNDTKPTGPAPISGSGHLPPIQITYPEPGTLNSPQAFSGLSFNFGDTKHRLVRLPLTATSRYASYFSRSITGTLRSPTVWTLLETGETGIQPLTERVQAVVTPAAPSAHFANYATLERDVHYTIDYQAGTIKAVDGSTAVGQKVEVTFTPLPDRMPAQ